MTTLRALVLLLAVGCTPSLGSKLVRRTDLQLSPPLPAARVDLEASTVVIDGVLLGDLTGDAVRETVGRSLQAYLGDQSRAASPARFRLRASTNQFGGALFWLFPCFVDFILIGCPVAIQSAHADLDLEVGGRRFSGSGESRNLMGLYYNLNARGVLGEAIAQAIDDLAARAGKAK